MGRSSDLDDSFDRSDGGDAKAMAPGGSGLFDAPVGLESKSRFQPICGTFGCTLPNNHRGLHALPEDEEGGPRRKRSKAVEPDARTSGRGSSPQPARRPVKAPASTPVDDEVGEPPLTAAASSKSSVPPAPPSSDDGMTNLVRVPLEPREGLCKKMQFCQRAKNHPGVRLSQRAFSRVPSLDVLLGALASKRAAKRSRCAAAEPSQHPPVRALAACFAQACARPQSRASRRSAAFGPFATAARARSQRRATRTRSTAGERKGTQESAVSLR